MLIRLLQSKGKLHFIQKNITPKPIHKRIAIKENINVNFGVDIFFGSR